MFYTNADCLLNKFDELPLRIKDSMCDIISVAEVKPKSNPYTLSLSELHIKDYDMYDNFSEDGRGILIYVHKTIKSNKIDTDTLFKESVWVNIDMNSTERIAVGCVYRSPNSTAENNSQMLNLLKSMTENKSQVLIMGDFNLPKIDWTTYQIKSDTESKETQFLECVRDCYLYPKCTEPTRIRINNEASLLDLILVGNEQAINCIDYESPLGKSYHRVLQFEYQCSIQRINYKKLKYYYDKANYTSMKETLTSIN